MKWFEVFIGRIQEVEVDRVTDLSVWIKGSRRARFGAWSYFPTWEEAKEHLVHEAQTRVDVAEIALDSARATLEKRKALRRD